MRKVLAGLITAGLLLSIGTTASFAAKKGKGKGGKDGNALFKKMDTNGDGKISFEEFKAFHDAKKANGKNGANKEGKKGKGKKGNKDLRAIFNKLDKDNDGFLSPQELKAGHPKKHKNKNKN